MKKQLHAVLALLVIPMLLGAGSYWVKTEHVCLKAIQKKETSSCCQKFHKSKSHEHKTQHHNAGDCVNEKCCVVTVIAISPSIQDFTTGAPEKLENQGQFFFAPVGVSDKTEKILLAKHVRQAVRGHSPPFLKAYNRQLLTLHNVLRC